MSRALNDATIKCSVTVFLSLFPGKTWKLNIAIKWLRLAHSAVKKKQLTFDDCFYSALCNHVQMQQTCHKCQQILQQVATENLVTAPIWQSQAFRRDTARISFIFTIYAMYYEFDYFEYKTDLTVFWN